MTTGTLKDLWSASSHQQYGILPVCTHPFGMLSDGPHRVRVRAWAMAPLVVIGLKAERRLLRIPLFIDYRERNDVPVTAFQATLQVVALFYRS